jgi:hypothetical protein
MILSFLKRERFTLFVSKRYRVPTRTFQGVPDRFHERFRPFHERFWTFVKFLRSEKLRNGHETVMKHSEMARNIERSGTFRNGERSGTLDSLKRSYCTR